MVHKKLVPIGRKTARRIVGVDPKNMNVEQRNTMIKHHLEDIRRAMAANEFSAVTMFGHRITLLAELNAKELEQK